MPSTMNLHYRDQKVVALQAAKCGTTSVADAMTPLLGPNNQTALRRSAIPRISTMDAFDARNRGYLIIAVCRNPFDRLVSCWKDKVVRNDHPNLLKHGITHGMDFEEFVEHVCRTADTAETDPHIRSQTFDWVWEGAPVWHELAFLESIEETWGRIQRLVKDHCGVRPKPLKRLNDTDEVEAPGWTKFHVDAVVERYEQDFRLLGYPLIPEEPEEAKEDRTDTSEDRTGTDG